MPSFVRKTPVSSASVNGRRFFVKKATPVHTVRKAFSPKKTVPPVKPVEVEPDVRKTDTENFEETMPSLSKLLTPADSKQPILPVNEDPDANAIYQDDEENEPAAFDGVSDQEEQEELYNGAILYERKKAKVVEEQLRTLAEEHEKERKTLESQIKALKSELHRTVPIQDNKFFSLSKQLRDAIVEIETLASQEGIQLQTLPTAAPTVETSPAAPVVSETPAASAVSPPPVPATVPVPTTAAPTVAAVTPPPPAEIKSLSKKKTLITGVTAVVIILVISGALIGTLTAKPKVDQKLVQQYLSQQNGGQVMGAQTSNGSPAPTVQKPATDPSQADVSFEQSEWDSFNDTQFGVLLQYPKNAVKAIRTESSLTFVRKTGYLFKVQRIETALTIQEYWKQIKATSLNYDVIEEKFKGKPALKLELTDMADYPGNRYLVKEGEFIYDIWYATPSNNFSKDDIARAEKMLASISVVGVK